MKVRALNTYSDLKIEDNELGRIPEEGEEFEITEERADVLLGNNDYGVAFVEVVKSEDKEDKKGKGKGKDKTPNEADDDNKEATEKEKSVEDKESEEQSTAKADAEAEDKKEEE